MVDSNETDYCTSMSTTTGNYIKMDFVGLNYHNDSNDS